MRFDFTEDTRAALQGARDAAARLRHDFVGPEHILLGLLEVNGEGRELLERSGASREQVESELLAMLRPGTAVPTGKQLPYTSRAKRVLELAMEEARQERADRVSGAHLLLALVAEERSPAAEVLKRRGISRHAAAPGGRGEVDAGGALPVRLDDASELSIYEQIVAQVQEAVATGVLAAGARLPPVRRASEQLDVAPGTVARAYSELERLGVVVTQGARGTRVADRQTPPAPSADRPAMLVGLLRPVAVAAFHLGATAAELRAALESAMRGIFGESAAEG
jgi:DNA-binding transcriptional regulator YhcF (GntR family)